MNHPGCKKPIIGSKFGRLLVVKYSHSLPVNGKQRHYYICLCDCGSEKRILASALNPNGSKSCGCLRRDVTIKRGTSHGLYYHPLWRTYQNIIARCEAPNHKSFHNYGGRGIGMCPKWRNDFLSFVADMGTKPSPKHSIDRVNNDGNYEPGNCKWKTMKEQSFNRRTNLLITIGEITQPLGMWCRQYGKKYSMVNHRLRKGWEINRALFQENVKTLQEKARREATITVLGVTKPVQEWASAIGLSPKHLMQRINRGWSAEKSVSQKKRFRPTFSKI